MRSWGLNKACIDSRSSRIQPFVPSVCFLVIGCDAS